MYLKVNFSIFHKNLLAKTPDGPANIRRTSITVVSDTGSIGVGVISGFGGPLAPRESPNGVTDKALATAGVDAISLFGGGGFFIS